MTSTPQLSLRRSGNARRACFWLCAAALAVFSLQAAYAPARTAPDASQREGYHYYEVGDLDAPRPAATRPGLMLVGGGDWPYDAFRWMIEKAGHGRIVILRASGANEAQDEFFKDIGG